RRLARRARTVIGSPRTTVLVSAASVWEITTKARLGKLPRALDVAVDVPACVHSQGFVGLEITLPHGQRAGALGGSHRDPFDRLLVAQAQVENLPIVSNDPVFDRYAIRRIW
ncbi:MAG: type II toxin-antitoxin system VapC family toxin, partial [Gemmatimonadetes bacterium]|nr:type II toxin-antitoxin system VapC family toxin [Gemmatimonadota bacterium]